MGAFLGPEGGLARRGLAACFAPSFAWTLGSEATLSSGLVLPMSAAAIPSSKASRGSVASSAVLTARVAQNREIVHG